MSTGTSPERHLIDLVTGFWQTQSLYVATHLGVIDQLSTDQAVHGPTLAKLLDVHGDALDRLLNYLVSIGVLEGGGAAGYRLSASGALLRTDSGSGMREHILLYGGLFYRAWEALERSIQTGESALSHVFGTDLFSYLQQHPDSSEMYERMMTAGTPFFTSVNNAYDFSGARRIVDVAGGHGDLLHAILRACQKPQAVLFDAPHVVAESSRYALLTDYPERCQAIGGDFFQEVPREGDVYLLSRILHCFDDDSCHRILTNCRQAIAAGGTLIVLEKLLTTGAESVLAHGYNMHMLVVLGAGRERTQQEYADLLTQAGFALQSVHALPLDTHLLVARCVT